MSTGLVLALKLDHLRKLEENSSTLKPPPPPGYLNSGAKITATTTTTTRTRKTAWTWILTDFGWNPVLFTGKTAKKRFWMAEVERFPLCIHPDQSWQRRCRWMRKRSLWPKGEGGEDHKHPVSRRKWCKKDGGASKILGKMWGSSHGQKLRCGVCAWVKRTSQ